MVLIHHDHGIHFETLQGPFDLCSTLPSLDALGFEQCTTSSLAPVSIKKLHRNPFSKWLMLSFYWDGHLWEAGYIPLNHWSAKKESLACQVSGPPEMVGVQGVLNLVNVAESVITFFTAPVELPGQST